jgi:hypothetical protein
MWMMTMVRLMWEMWAMAPECNCSSEQGRKECKCHKR